MYALVARATIDRAKGILMAERGCDEDAAFTVLTRRSQVTNVPLRDVAKAIVYKAQDSDSGARSDAETRTGACVLDEGVPRAMTERSREQATLNEQAPTPSGKDPLRRSRTSAAWFAVVALAALLLLLVTFIAQNTQEVQVSFLGWQGQAPLAVALLIASVVGILLAVVAGSLRILQLRRRVRRHGG
jgi:uncharacterized integral membrane protein